MSEQPGFWDIAMQAQKVMQEIAERKDWITVWQSAQLAVEDVGTLIELGDEADDPSMEADIDGELLKAQDAVDTLELRRMPF